MDQDTRDMLLDTAGRFFAERCGKDIVNGVEKGVWPADFWTEIEEMGLPLGAVPEDTFIDQALAGFAAGADGGVL